MRKCTSSSVEGEPSQTPQAKQIHARCSIKNQACFFLAFHPTAMITRFVCTTPHTHTRTHAHININVTQRYKRTHARTHSWPKKHLWSCRHCVYLWAQSVRSNLLLSAMGGIISLQIISFAPHTHTQTHTHAHTIFAYWFAHWFRGY